MIATVLAGTVVAKDESVGRAIEEIPAAQRALRAGWFGIPALTEGYSTLDESARKSLAGASKAEPAALVLYRESTIAGRYIGLGAVDGLESWVTLRSGRMPRTCEPERCEVVRLRGAGSLPNVEGLRLVEVGTAAIRSPVLFGDFVAPAETERARAALSPFYRDAIDYHRPAPPPLVLAEGVEGLVDSPELENVYRSYAWVVPLGPGDVRAWNIDGFAEDVAQARTSFQNTSFAADLTAPLADLQSASESSEVAGRRLLLVGGESAALLFAFAILAAVSMRRDTEAARRRLTWFGARRWQLSLFTGTEAAAVAVVGTAVGWALGTAAGAVVASRAGAPVGEVLAHSTLSSTGLLVAAAVAARARPRARGGAAGQAHRLRPALVLGPGCGCAGRGRGHRRHAAPRRPRPGDPGPGVRHGRRARPPPRARHLRRRGRLRAPAAPGPALARARLPRSVGRAAPRRTLAGPPPGPRGRRGGVPRRQRRPCRLRRELPLDARARPGGAGGVRRPARLHAAGRPDPAHPRQRRRHARAPCRAGRRRARRAGAAPLGQRQPRRRPHGHHHPRARPRGDPRASRLARRLQRGLAGDAREPRRDRRRPGDPRTR